MQKPKHQKEVAVSQSYDEVKKQALEQPLLRKTVRIGDIKIVDEGRIEYKGVELQLSAHAFHSLIKRLGVPVSFQNHVHNLLGPQAKMNLLNVMKTAVSAQKNKEIMFIGNPKNSQVVGVTENVSMLSAASFFELAESTINKYDLQIKDCSISLFGDVVIQATSPVAAGIKDLPKDHADDEEYYPGLAFKNSLFAGTALSPYTFRMICANGLITPNDSSAIRISGFDTDKLKTFYNRVNALAKGNFISVNYNKQVLKAIDSYASLSELKFLADSMIHSGTDSKIINQFVPYFDCVNKYEKLGIKTEYLSKEQLANAKTNVKLWSAINGLTDFATHKYDGIDLSASQRALLQQKAGAVLNKKKFDTESLMPSLV